ncbi:MAG: class I SAM-dependent methyltransferase [Victivallaceae bacterium]|nr:class I SAM-dependent methyltransferase [Victivallaceae bacterium]
MTRTKIFLKPGRDKSVRLRHPWIFSGAIRNLEGAPESGDPVEIYSAGREFLAVGAFSAASQIAVRVWEFARNIEIDREFLRERIQRAVALRPRLGFVPQQGCRLVFSEADNLPGVIADRYGATVVLCLLSAGAEKYREVLAELFLELDGVTGVYERSDAAVRTREELPMRTGLICGEEPPEFCSIEENDMKLLVDVRRGHKTGFYLDQRDARLRVRDFAAGKRVLNCFSYTGGFGVSAALGGAQMVTDVDSSASALELAGRNYQENKIAPEQHESIEGDVFCVLRKFRAEKRRFDLIVLDPPKLVESQKALIRGARAYKDMALCAYGLLEEGGVLFNFSCSGLMDEEFFRKITFEAALDAGVDAVTVGSLRQSGDHPVLLTAPESFYLKGLISVVTRRLPNRNDDTKE